ncbi:PREDICTED: craniofacial development protein 2-like [Acropora digitifera]|uniref:craniofacial development protein 2-like n=1 Tax=Acropora digitifera TaxID=70779 RepID=UPI00077B1163|nr:PREDICTED: craniofacial development protein 2-like [Acropora digitifera]
MGTWNLGSMSGTEVCEELRKRRMDVFCLQEVGWRGQGAQFLGMKGRRYKLQWSGNSDGTGGVGVLVKEELWEKVVEVRRRSERVITVVMVLEEEVLRIICVYGPKSGRMAAEKEHFYDDLSSEWDLHSMGELVLGMGDFNGRVGKQIKGYEDVHGGNGIGGREKY